MKGASISSLTGGILCLQFIYILNSIQWKEAIKMNEKVTAIMTFKL